MSIIGLAGQKGVGKDTVADILVRDYGYRKMSFAAPLKELAKELFGLTDKQVYGPSQEREAELNLGDIYHHCNSNYTASWNRIYEMFPDIGGRQIRQQFGAVFNESARMDTTTPRWLLQKLGTDFGRALDKDVWTRAAFKAVDADPSAKIVFTDVRFPKDEGQQVRDRGGLVWYISRPGYTADNPTHESEPTVASFGSVATMFLNNCGTIEVLETMVAFEMSLK